MIESKISRIGFMKDLGITNLKRELRTCRYYLRKWAYLQNNIEVLTPTETVCIKILYSALNEVSEEDRKWLKEKYHDTVLNEKGHMARRKDKDIADSLGIGLNDYLHIRVAAEQRLSPHMLKYREQFHKELMESFKKR